MGTHLPFVLVYSVLFIYPTYRMVAASFTDASLTLPGQVGRPRKLQRSVRRSQFKYAIVNTGFFVLLTVIPSTLLGLLIAMMVERFRGAVQSVVLALFFLPYVLPASVVANMWWAMFDHDYGVLAPLMDWIVGRPIAVFHVPVWVLPVVAVLTIWWTIGFNVLLFLAGLRNIPPELYEAAALDGAGRWAQFRSITWPLIWPVTALVLTIQLILQLKVFDQVYLLEQRLARRHGAGAVPLHHGLPAEPERLRLGHRAWPVRHRHGSLGAAIPVAAGARSA